MAIDFNADLKAILNTNEFAVPALYESIVNGNPVSSVTINGIFENDYFDIVDGESVVESSQPGFTCRTIDVAGVKHGDRLTINSVQYTIVGNKPSSFGVTVLPLEAP